MTTAQTSSETIRMFVGGGTSPDMSWVPHAACRGANIGDGEDEFFLSETEKARGLPNRVVTAKRLYCEQCPVMRECGEAATAGRYIGLWGGSWRSRDTSMYRITPIPEDS